MDVLHLHDTDYRLFQANQPGSLLNPLSLPSHAVRPVRHGGVELHKHGAKQDERVAREAHCGRRAMRSELPLMRYYVISSGQPNSGANTRTSRNARWRIRIAAGLPPRIR